MDARSNTKVAGSRSGNVAPVEISARSAAIFQNADSPWCSDHPTRRLEISCRYVGPFFCHCGSKKLPRIHQRLTISLDMLADRVLNPRTYFAVSVNTIPK